jgi:transcription elongation factor Elf1
MQGRRSSPDRAWSERVRREAATLQLMNDALSIECPHCGETFSLALDVSEGSAHFTVECEVCCRPMTVSVRICDDGEIEGVEVTEE